MKYMIEHNADRASLLLYGEVSETGGEGMVSGTDFVAQLMEAESRFGRIDVRINSIGGDVYPGIAIFNALRRCRSEVTLYIDGIAASIAGVIAMCGRRVEMSRYSRMMIHNVSGGCYGNKKDMQDMIDTIESLEDTLAGIISDRCGMDKQRVKDVYFDGTDHWLTANDALELGLVDAIYDVDPIPEGSTTDDIYRIFNNRLDEERRPKNNLDMKLEELKKISRFANCADESEAMTAIAGAAAQADRTEELEAENKALRQANEQLRQQHEERLTEQIDEAVSEAVKDGRIGKDQQDTYRNLLKSDYKNGMKALKAMKPMRMVKDMLEDETEAGEGPWAKRQRQIRDGLK